MNLVMSWIRVHLLSFARVRGSSKLVKSLWHLSKKVQGALQKLLFFFFFSRSTKNELCLVVWCKHKEVFDIILGKKFWFWFFLFLEQTCKGFKEEIWFCFGVSTLFFFGERERGCNFVVCCLIGKGSYEGEMFVCCGGDCWSNCIHVQIFLLNFF